MDVMVMGTESLELALQAGSSAVNTLDTLVQLAGEAGEITCEVSRCEWA